MPSDEEKGVCIRRRDGWERLSPTSTTCTFLHSNPRQYVYAFYYDDHYSYPLKVKLVATRSFMEVRGASGHGVVWVQLTSCAAMDGTLDVNEKQLPFCQTVTSPGTSQNHLLKPSSSSSPPPRPLSVRAQSKARKSGNPAILSVIYTLNSWPVVQTC